MNINPSVLAVIMGGGRGTRLYPLTKERCKPAVPLAGKYRLVDIPISNCLNSGINRIFLLTQFNTASLHRHVQSTYHFDSFGQGFVDIMAAEQTEKTDDWYQGTADAVRRNFVHFRTHPHDYLLILSGDALYRMDFRRIIAQHVTTGADVTISAIPIPLTRADSLGVMRVNDNLEVKEFAEKPKDPAVIARFALSAGLEARLTTPATEKRSLASMGIYVFSRGVLQDALDNTMTDFGKEVIPSLLGKKRLFAYVFEGYWEDIGTVRSFFDANLALAQPLPPFNFYLHTAPIYTHARFLPASKINKCFIDYVVVGDGSIITDATLKHCVIGIRAMIRDGSHLEDVVMMGADFYEGEEEIRQNAAQGVPNVGVGFNCQIRGAIIDKNARIGDGCVLSPDGKSNGDYPHGVMIRDGVLVVPKGGVIPAGTTI
ncbi:MAG TPA: glucose-1-phosphate adenylyltransferase [Opitutaceae bacterium]|nr:glucose-1-phosphate adenylyltransferase [Opitutaceae bacterium]